MEWETRALRSIVPARFAYNSFCRYTCPNHPVSGSSRNNHHRGTLEAVAEARRAEKGRPGHTKGGGKRSRWGGKKPARASGSQPPWRAMFDATQRPNLRNKTSTPEQRRMGSVRPVAPARDSPGDSLPDVSARGPCATRSARPAAPSWPCRSRITSKRSKSAPKPDHALGRPHHR